jgi:hypothetical protein
VTFQKAGNSTYFTVLLLYNQIPKRVELVWVVKLDSTLERKMLLTFVERKLGVWAIVVFSYLALFKGNLFDLINGNWIEYSIL